MSRLEAWHFVGATLRDGRPVPADGEILRHEGELELCCSGLHASERVIDALKYAPGSIVCRVVLGGTILAYTDKAVASERTVLWRLDAEPILLEFARWCALQVAHLWAPPEIVKRYLETGNETIQAAAWDAARDAAWVAAQVAARAAAEVAAEVAARDAAWTAARDAAWTAARAAAWDAAQTTQNAKLEEMILAARGDSP